MRFLLPAILALSLPSACEPRGAGVPPAAAGPATPVLIELFTSEGCSSCPPADDLLRTLVETQPIPGVEVIALSEHVEYWNGLGWRDPFSAPTFTERQTAYQGAVFRSSPIYTPQLVIDGTQECIGSDRTAVRQAVLRAARAAKAALHVEIDPGRGERTAATIDVQIPSTVLRKGVADVMVAVVQNGLVSAVARGENRGRTLRHDGVVRHIERVGTIEADANVGSFTATVPVDRSRDSTQIRIVAFVQERAGRAVIGASWASVPPQNTSVDGNPDNRRRAL